MLKFNILYILITLVFSSGSLYSQKNAEEQLINDFLTDLFQEHISPKKVVDKYLTFSTTKNEGGVIGYKVAVQHIENIRLKKNEKPNWLIPNKVSNLKGRIVNYKECEILDEDDFFTAVDDSLKKEIYVLLDVEKKEILQYFQIRNHKIRGFTLFVKPNYASFLVYD